MMRKGKATTTVVHYRKGFLALGGGLESSFFPGPILWIFNGRRTITRDPAMLEGGRQGAAQRDPGKIKARNDLSTRQRSLNQQRVFYPGKEKK